MPRCQARSPRCQFDWQNSQFRRFNQPHRGWIRKPTRGGFFFWTNDIAAAEEHLKGYDVELASGVVDIGSVSFLQFRAPDGNLLMVCPKNG